MVNFFTVLLPVPTKGLQDYLERNDLQNDDMNALLSSVSAQERYWALAHFMLALTMLVATTVFSNGCAAGTQEKPQEMNFYITALVLIFVAAVYQGVFLKWTKKKWL